MTLQVPRIHAVTNDQVIALPDFAVRAAALASAPGIAVHIRSGTLGGRALAQAAESIIESSQADRVFVNDRADVARIVGAGGVHLPAGGLSVALARSIMPRGCCIGRSTHSPDEVARAAAEGADYAFLGPIWPTASHPDRAPLGKDVLSLGYDLPVIAIGGITAARIPECVEAGAFGVAAISAVWCGNDAASTARDLSLSFPL